MKYVEANVTSNFKFNDNVEITSHPTEGVPCIKIGDRFFSPSIIWLEYQPDAEADSQDILNAQADTESGGLWVEIDEAEEENLISEVYDEFVDFRALTDEEINDLEEEE
jgi:hypothetical protein